MKLPCKTCGKLPCDRYTKDPDGPCGDQDTNFETYCHGGKHEYEPVIPDASETDTYYIVDHERSRVSDMTVFWREKGHGYTVNIDDAGEFTLAEARRQIGDDRSMAIHAALFDPAKFMRICPLSELARVKPLGIPHDKLRGKA